MHQLTPLSDDIVFNIGGFIDKHAHKQTTEIFLDMTMTFIYFC